MVITLFNRNIMTQKGQESRGCPRAKWATGALKKHLEDWKLDCKNNVQKWEHYTGHEKNGQ